MPVLPLEPYVLAAISDLRLVARRVVDSFLAGVHSSVRSSSGLEFSEYRSYQPGDDLRFVDWKMFARSDRYYVRQSEMESSVTVQFLLDASGSMLHEESGITKIAYARWLAGSLAYLAARQGDSIGLEVINSVTGTLLPPARDPQQLRRFLLELERAVPAGNWPSDRPPTTPAPVRERTIFVVITDLYEKEVEISDFLAKLQATKEEILLMHLMGRRELEFEFDGRCAFEDLETGHVVELQAAQVRQRYVNEMQDWLSRLSRQFAERGVHYERFTLDQTLDVALRSYLLSRMKAPCSS